MLEDTAKFLFINKRFNSITSNYYHSLKREKFTFLPMINYRFWVSVIWYEFLFFNFQNCVILYLTSLVFFILSNFRKSSQIFLHWKDLETLVAKVKVWYNTLMDSEKKAKAFENLLTSLTSSFWSSSLLIVLVKRCSMFTKKRYCPSQNTENGKYCWPQQHNIF